MKKWIALLLSVLLVASLLTGCGCEHEWNEPNCDTPKTCQKCGFTEGAPLGHNWLAATCDTPKTCEVCGKAEGEALGHSWVDATCETAKTCSTCHLTEGEALGHSWADATTDAPKTCTTCSATEGEKINVDDRFTTGACQHLFGSWTGQMTVDGEKELNMQIEGESLDYITFITYTFTNDGKMIMDITFDEESYLHVVELYTIELMYATLTGKGMTRDQADAAMMAQYGMGVVDYVKAEVAKMDVDDYAQKLEWVYYVDGDSIYAAADWDDEMSPETYTLEGDKLTISDSTTGQVLEMTKQP